MTDGHTIYFGLQLWQWCFLFVVSLFYLIACLPEFDQTNKDSEIGGEDDDRTN